jgi:hypothetical protein
LWVKAGIPVFARHGVELDRSTLANWIGGAVWSLEPLQARLAEHVFAAQTLFADDTPIPVSNGSPPAAGSSWRRAPCET